MTPYSNATVEGFATCDPIVKTTKTQKKVATFSISISHYSMINEPPRVSFVDIEGWERVADDIELIVAQEIRLIQRG